MTKYSENKKISPGTIGAIMTHLESEKISKKKGRKKRKDSRKTECLNKSNDSQRNSEDESETSTSFECVDENVEEEAKIEAIKYYPGQQPSYYKAAMRMWSKTWDSLRHKKTNNPGPIVRTPSTKRKE